MKKFTNKLRVVIAIAMMLIVGLSANAHDFEVDGIYYNVTSSVEPYTVEVTFKDSSTYYTGDIVIPESVTYNEIQYSVTSIGDNAFISCSDLTSVKIPNSVIEIGYAAFFCCYGLTSIEIPNSVIKISESVFLGCMFLENIVVSEGNPIYDSRDNSNAIIKTTTNTLIQGCNNSIIPISITKIGDGAFSYFDFASIEIPNSVTSVGDYAFSYCLGLTSVTIPTSIESMGEQVFYACVDIKEVYLQSEEVPTAYDTTIFDSSLDLANVNLYVPAGSGALYEVADGWNQFNIIEFDYNNLEIEDAETYKGTEIEVPVMLNNINDITAFQCTLTLSEGLEVSTTDGVYDITLTDRKGIDHQLTATLQADGSIKLLCYSMQTLAFSGNEGALFNIRMNVSESAVGQQTVGISDIILTSTSEKYTPADITATITVKEYINGDANEDGSVDVMDIVYIAQYILGTPQPDFLPLAGDYNEDGDIDVFDIVNIATSILNGNVVASAYSPNLSKTSGESQLQLTADATSSSTITIGVDSEDRYSAFQMDIHLPKGVEIISIRANDAETHTLAYKTDGNRVRVICYSLSAADLQDNANLFSIELKTTATAAENIVINNILFSDSEGRGRRAETAEIGTSGIERVDGGVNIYAESGKIVIESDIEGEAEVMGLDGIAGRHRISEGRNEIETGSGVRIVRFAGKTVKLII